MKEPMQDQPLTDTVDQSPLLNTGQQGAGWVVDDCPDARGFSTIRFADGDCPHGDTSRQPVATVYDDDHARLIAAAPCLLAALQGLLESYAAYVDIDEVTNADIVEPVQAARAAIAKASQP